jgi:hypothetical protein
MKYLVVITLPIMLLADSAPAFEQLAGLSSSEHQPSDLSKALNLVMAAATPELYFHKREIMIEKYENAKVNKALAVNIKRADTGKLRIRIVNRLPPSARSKAASSGLDHHANCWQ